MQGMERLEKWARDKVAGGPSKEQRIGSHDMPQVQHQTVYGKSPADPGRKQFRLQKLKANHPFD